ncbi:hypothetical protein Tco_0697559 [Tanacetum coccineum]
MSHVGLLEGSGMRVVNWSDLPCADEGFFVGYSLNSKAFRVFNSRTRIVEENLHIRFSENTPNVVGTKASDNAGHARKEIEPIKNYILLPLWTADPPFSQDPKSSHDDGSKPSSENGKKVDEDPIKESECNDQEKEDNVNSTNNVNAASTNEVNVVGGKISIELPFDLNMHALEDYSIFDFSRNDEDDGAEADMNNLDTTIQVSPIPTTRIHKDHSLVLCDWIFAIVHKTRKRMSKKMGDNIGKNQKRSMIGSLMYLTSSRPDIMFAVCACARYQVNLKVSHLHAGKKIFLYLKGQPKLDLWCPKNSPFNLVAYTDSDYARASLDKKSTTGGKAKKSVRLMMEKFFGMELELMLVTQS